MIITNVCGLVLTMYFQKKYAVTNSSPKNCLVQSGKMETHKFNYAFNVIYMYFPKLSKTKMKTTNKFSKLFFHKKESLHMKSL